MGGYWKEGKFMSKISDKKNIWNLCNIFIALQKSVKKVEGYIQKFLLTWSTVFGIREATKSIFF